MSENLIKLNVQALTFGGTSAIGFQHHVVNSATLATGGNAVLTDAPNFGVISLTRCNAAHGVLVAASM